MEVLFLSIFGLCAAVVVAVLYALAMVVGAYTFGFASMVPWMALGLVLLAAGVALVRRSAVQSPWTQRVGLPAAWPVGL